MSAAPYACVRELALDAVTAVNGEAAAALVYAADVACYPPPLRATRASVDALCAAFPEGVRLYLGWDGHRWRPVGYRAWHPIDPAWIGRMRRDAAWPSPVPVAPVRTGAAYLYNYSVVPELIGTPVARALMSGLATAVADQPALVADVVSDHGRRAARRWGLEPALRRTIRGAPWELWVRG